LIGVYESRKITIFRQARNRIKISKQTAVQYARTVAQLRRSGALAVASKADLWIAAWALEHRALLATRNRRHFERVEGLRIIDF